MMKRWTAFAFAACILVPAAQASTRQQEHSRKEIRVLKDSAAALKPINADLSDKLSQYAEKEAAEREGKEGEQAESARQADVQLLRDSAAALEPSRPDLAKSLKRYAARESREKMQESPQAQKGY